MGEVVKGGVWWEMGGWWDRWGREGISVRGRKGSTNVAGGRGTDRWQKRRKEKGRDGESRMDDGVMEYKRRKKLYKNGRRIKTRQIKSTRIFLFYWLVYISILKLSVSQKAFEVELYKRSSVCRSQTWNPTKGKLKIPITHTRVGARNEVHVCHDVALPWWLPLSC